MVKVEPPVPLVVKDPEVDCLKRPACAQGHTGQTGQTVHAIET